MEGLEKSTLLCILVTVLTLFSPFYPFSASLGPDLAPRIEINISFQLPLFADWIWIWHLHCNENDRQQENIYYESPLNDLSAARAVE